MAVVKSCEEAWRRLKWVIIIVSYLRWLEFEIVLFDVLFLHDVYLIIVRHYACWMSAALEDYGKLSV